MIVKYCKSLIYKVLSGNIVVKDKDNKMVIKKYLVVLSLLGVSFVVLG